MNITIYINRDNEKLLAQEPNKGGLINRLLAEHYSKNTITTYSLEAKPAKNLTPSTSVPIPETLGGPPDPYVKKNTTLATPRKQKPTPGQLVPEVMMKSLCPHGYAKGFCKKSDCNRKYQK